MPATEAEVLDKAFRIATGLAPDQEPGEEEIAPLREIYPRLLERLRQPTDFICDVQDQDAVLDEWFMPICRLLANWSAPELSGSPIDQEAQAADFADLRRTSAGVFTYAVMQGSYF